MIQIIFEFTTPKGKFRDALYLPENHSYTNAQIEQMKQERLNNWLGIFDNEEEEVIKETVIVDGVEYEKVLIDGQIMLKPTGV